MFHDGSQHIEALKKKWRGQTPEERFWKRVDRRGPGECWSWQGCINATGYGLFTIISLGIWLAHRASWVFAHGPIESSSLVCHHCDNPPCVNSAHLFLGTQVENMGDCQRKGRNAFAVGAEHSQAKLTAAQVVEMRRLLKQRVLMRQEIADSFGVSKSLVEKIHSRQVWAHLPEVR